MTSVRIAGKGLTDFGQHPERTTRNLFAEASNKALNGTAITRDDIEKVYYGNFIGQPTEDQGHYGPLITESLGINAPTTHVENACASAGVAVREGVKAIESGAADVVLVGGAERMTNLDVNDVTAALATAGDGIYEVGSGMTFPGAYALLARAYFETYGGSREDLAHIAVKNHAHAANNEYAQFQSEIDIDDVLEAPMIADPLGMYDACPTTDGASAAILVSEEYAESHDLEAPIAITGSGYASDKLALQNRSSLVETPATANAAESAFSQAEIDPGNVDVLEVHDCFTIAEVLALEGMGFYEPGTAITAAKNGETTKEGELPVNLSGGLKAKGHPVGATGCSQLVEMDRILRGEHPNSSAVPESTHGVIHNAGGTVASALVHVLEVVE